MKTEMFSAFMKGSNKENSVGDADNFVSNVSH